MITSATLKLLRLPLFPFCLLLHFLPCILFSFLLNVNLYPALLLLLLLCCCQCRLQHMLQVFKAAGISPNLNESLPRQSLFYESSSLFLLLLAPCKILLTHTAYFVIPHVLSFHLSLVISPALCFLHSSSLHASLSLSLCPTDGSCPWQHDSNHLEGLVLFFFFSSLSFQLAWTVCVLAMCVQDAHTHLYPGPTVKIQAKPYKRLSDYVAVKQTRGLCV